MTESDSGRDWERLVMFPMPVTKVVDNKIKIESSQDIYSEAVRNVILNGRLRELYLRLKSPSSASSVQDSSESEAVPPAVRTPSHTEPREATITAQESQQETAPIDVTAPISDGNADTSREPVRPRTVPQEVPSSGDETVLTPTTSAVAAAQEDTAPPETPPGPVPDICPICDESCESNNAWQPFQCGHTGHIGCMQVYMESHDTCPLCEADADVPLGPVAAAAVPEGEPSPYTCPTCDEPCTLDDLWWPFDCDHPGHTRCMNAYLQSSSRCSECNAGLRPEEAKSIPAPLQPAEMETETCCYCDEPCGSSDWMQLFACEHVGHLACLEQNVPTQRECPECQAALTDPDLFPQAPDQEADELTQALLEALDARPPTPVQEAGTVSHASIPVSVAAPPVPDPPEEEESPGDCPICLSACTPDDAWRPYQCRHVGHEPCLREWIRSNNANRNNCPYCHAAVVAGIC